MKPSSRLTTEFHDNIAELDAGEWNQCAGDDNPFVSHEFLSALESSGCASAEEGWTPHHLVLRSDGQMVAATPTYLKSHSFGEYIFDHSWAGLYQRVGLPYYPKLQIAVPFSPVPGPRLLVRDQFEVALAHQQLVEALLTEAASLGCSSVHCNFAPTEEAASLERLGFLSRWGHQYHWFNRDYADFDAFLAQLSSRKRKNIRKERERAHSHGLRLETLTGDEICEATLDTFFLFYLETSSRKWGRPYLNRQFFSELKSRLGNRFVLFLAKDGERPLAGAWNLRGKTALFGRNWGCLGFFDCLHFELCYYQAIEYAITHKLGRVEAGAQGLHKIQRGYEPVKTHSNHYLLHPDLRRVLADYLAQERMGISQELEVLAEHMPFRKQ